MIIDEIIVIILNLKAGINECESHKREIYPSGTVILNQAKIVEFKNAVILESKEYVGKEPFWIKYKDELRKGTKSAVIVNGGKYVFPTNHAIKIAIIDALIQELIPLKIRHLEITRLVRLIKNTITSG